MRGLRETRTDWSQQDERIRTGSARRVRCEEHERPARTSAPGRTDLDAILCGRGVSALVGLRCESLESQELLDMRPACRAGHVRHG